MDPPRQQRQRRMLMLCLGISGSGALGWAVFFGLRGDWLIVAIECLVLSSCAVSVACMRAGRLDLASRLLLGTLYAVLVLFAAVIDVPSPGLPGSTQHLMLALGVVACLLMRDEPPWLRHGMPLLFFVTWVAFTAGDLSLATRYAMPPAVQAVGAWVNPVMAAVTILLALQSIQADAAERSALGTELRDAIAAGDLVLHYQPQIARDGRVIGAEALVRWQHARRGLVGPGEFIPVAERHGLMGALGGWVLAEGCRQLAAWAHDPRTAHLSLAVNVSAAQFEQPDFVDRVLASLARSGADPRRLKLELTESLLARDIDGVVLKMQALKTHGIAFSLDDFGTGYSSLGYLRRLPLDQLKIDRSFVAQMRSSASDAAIVRTVVELGRSLGLDVIAEGVETEDQRQALHTLGCAAYQGFLFARPMAAAALPGYVAQHQPLPATSPLAGPAPAAAPQRRQTEPA